MDAGTNTPEIQKIINLVAPWSVGYKLLGAGGGGFMFIMAKDEKSATQIRHELMNSPINNRARFVDFSVFKNWPSGDKKLKFHFADSFPFTFSQ